MCQSAVLVVAAVSGVVAWLDNHLRLLMYGVHEIVVCVVLPCMEAATFTAASRMNSCIFRGQEHCSVEMATAQSCRGRWIGFRFGLWCVLYQPEVVLFHVW
jgi:hypothetical protein